MSGATSFGDSINSALKQLSALTNSRLVCLVEGSKHTCYKPGCGNSYETGRGDFCPKCGTNQETLEKAMSRFYLGLIFFRAFPSIIWHKYETAP